MAKVVYQGIYQTLKHEIGNGTYAYQSLLPSEAELTRRFGCSHSTVRRAIAELTADGYVQPLHGKGVRNIYNPESPDFGDSDVYGLETHKESAARQGFSPETRCSTFEHVVADATLARVTGFSEGAELLHIMRSRYRNGEGVSSDESYYLASEVPGLTKEIVEDSIYQYLEEVLGMQIVISKRVVTMEHANEFDCATKGLTGTDYVAVMRCNAYDNNGIMLEYTETRQKPSFFKMRVNSQRRVEQPGLAPARDHGTAA